MANERSQIAKELLKHLAVPYGTANVVYRKSDAGGELIVEYSPTSQFQMHEKLSVFCGIPVKYVLRRPARAFA